MSDPLELRVEALLEAAADPDDPIASSAIAAQAVAAAAALLTMAARSSRSLGLAAQTESVRARASALIPSCARAYSEATTLLARRASAGEPEPERDFLLGRALHRAAEGPTAVAEAAGDAALLAIALRDSCIADRIPDVRAACAMAEGAAAASVLLVEVNLVAGDADGELLKRARRGAAAAAEARRSLDA